MRYVFEPSVEPEIPYRLSRDWFRESLDDRTALQGALAETVACNTIGSNALFYILAHMM